MSYGKRRVRFTRADALLFAVGLPVVAAAGGLLWLSQQMVAPPRPTIATSQRPVVGLVLRSSADGTRVVRSVDPARRSGLRAGDRIVRLDKLEAPTVEAIAGAVREAGAGHHFLIEAKRPVERGPDSLVLADVVAEYRRVSPADEGLPYESVEFKNADKLTLRGWYIPPPKDAGSRAGAVVYGHGNAADRRQWLAAAWTVHERGVAQLLIDFAGRGESEGEVVTLGAREAEDLRAGLDWLSKRPEVDPDRLALAGRSMGAVAAILAAAEDPRVKVLVLDSPFADLGALTDRLLEAWWLPSHLVRPILFRVAGWRAGYDPGSIRPLEAIAKIKAPVLLVHGERDELVPIADARALEKAAGGACTFIPLKGEGHNTPRATELYDRVAGYLAAALTARTAS